MNIRVAIVDDEPLAVELLGDYVHKTPGLVLTEATTEVFKVLQLVQDGKVDLVLLDVQMPELTGLQFLKIINGRCDIILTTAYTEYAIEGFEHNVVDYLLKPISYERFYRAIEKLKSRPPAGYTSHSAFPDHFFIKSEYRLIRVQLHDIIYIEALRDYIAVHASMQKIMSLESMSNMEQLLPASLFVRIHKSYIISLQHIKYIERNTVAVGNVVLPLGNSYREGFEKVIGKK